MKSFKDVPLTIGELRTQKTPDCKLWSPRDLLVSLLRDIDSGNVTVTDLVVCYARDENHGRYIRAGITPHTTFPD